MRSLRRSYYFQIDPNPSVVDSTTTFCNMSSSSSASSSSSSSSSSSLPTLPFTSTIPGPTILHSTRVIANTAELNSSVDDSLRTVCKAYKTCSDSCHRLRYRVNLNESCSVNDILPPNLRMTLSPTNYPSWVILRFGARISLTLQLSFKLTR